MDAGVLPENVTCNEGLQLMIRNSGQAICVTDGAAAVLAELGIAGVADVTPASDGGTGADAATDGAAAIATDMFTDAEIEWIMANPVVRVAHDPGWFPIEFGDGPGEIGGVSGAYTALYEQATGIDFVSIDAPSWAAALAAVRDGRADMLPSAAMTEERSEYLGFTSPHTVLTADIIVHMEGEVDQDDLAGLRVATVRDYAIESWLDHNRPDIGYISYDSPEDALLALGADEIDAYLGNWIVTDYIAAQDGIEGIRNAGTLGDLYPLAAAYDKNKQELGSILQKVLDSVSDGEKIRILADSLQR